MYFAASNPTLHEVSSWLGALSFDPCSTLPTSIAIEDFKRQLRGELDALQAWKGSRAPNQFEYRIWIKRCDAQFSRLNHFQQGVIPQLYGSAVFLGDRLSVKRGDAGSVFAMILEIPDGLVISQEVHQPSRDYTPFGI